MNTKSLEKQSNKYRYELFDKFVKIKQGHPGSIFSILDVLPEDGKDALFYDTYGFILTPKNNEPEKNNKNRMVLSIKLNLESRLLNLSGFQE